MCLNTKEVRILNPVYFFGFYTILTVSGNYFHMFDLLKGKNIFSQKKEGIIVQKLFYLHNVLFCRPLVTKLLCISEYDPLPTV